MIKSLIKRTEDAICHASSELEQVRGVNRRANYNKLLKVLNDHSRELRILALEVDDQKNQWNV